MVNTAFDRRVKFVVGIGYLDDIEKKREAIRQVLSGIEGVLKEPAPWVYVEELAGSSVNMKVYFWVESPQANVLKIGDQVATGIKYAFDEAKIDMPYPHSVVPFHDATGTRDDDIGLARYLSAKTGGE